MTARKAKHRIYAVIALSLLLAVLPPSPGPPSATSRSPLTFIQTAAPPGSWALGLVVPQGSPLSSGEKLDWASVANVTALVKLPQGTIADDTILAVLSIMVGESSVVQVAAGLFPNTGYWKAVGWFIPDVGATPQEYEWSLNSSVPRISGGSSVVLSIFRSNGSWNYRVSDLDTRQAIAGAYESAPDSPIRQGDQESFALESYTTNATVLSRLGNLTLTTLFVSGKPVIGGTYYIGDWDPSHQPLFVVGGMSVPSAADLTNLGNGTFVWGYSQEWNTLEFPFSQALDALVPLTVVALAAILAFIAFRSRPGRGTIPGPPRKA